LVAYWPAQTITPDVAFAPLISLGVLQMVTGYEQGGKFYDPTGLPFLNTLTEIKNGFGYWVKVSADFNNFFYSQTEWQCGSNFTDSRDGKVYSTVQIGTQCWMKQNLNIGTRIDGTINQTNNGYIEKYCYSNLETNCDIYGGLYQWNEMMQYTTIESVQGICPPTGGWHLPSDVEWTALTNYLGGSGAGGAMKEIGTTHWLWPNTGATNSSGFTALPAGYRPSVGTFLGLGNYATIWSSTEYGGSVAYHQYLYWDWNGVGLGNYDKPYGCSVRCLKGN
jgi:uncharacterized protein (TIGR02145 family)